MEDINYKNKIRREILAHRSNMSDCEMSEKNIDISRQLFNLEQYKNASVIYSYISYKNEADTKSINLCALKEGRKVAVPRVRGNSMDFFFIDSYEDLEVGSFGILEPKAYAKKAIPCEESDSMDINARELILVPGVVFDEAFHRIGYGRGYYDKYFSAFPDKFIKTALAYDFQILKSIPSDEHDVCMDIIVSNSKIIM